MAEIFGNDVIGTTEQDLLPCLVDTVINASPGLKRTFDKTKKWSGRTHRPNFQISKNSNGSSYRGLEALSVAQSDNTVQGEYTISSYAIPVVIPGDQLSVNAVESTKAIDLLTMKIQIAANSGADDMATMFYGDGTGNGSKDILGLGAHVDDGTSVATIAGLSRSTYPTLAGTVTASGGTLTLAKMDTLNNAITDGMNGPTIGLVTKAVKSYFGQLLRPMMRQMVPVSGGEINGSASYKGLEHDGIQYVADPKCTSGAMILVDEKNVYWAALPSFGAKAIAYSSVVKGNDYSAPVGLGFYWSDWKIPVNGDGVIAHIFVKGQMVGTNPKRNGKLTGITGI